MGIFFALAPHNLISPIVNPLTQEKEELRPVVDGLVEKANALRAQVVGVAFDPPRDQSASEGARQEWEKYRQYLEDLHNSEGAVAKVQHAIAHTIEFAPLTWDAAWEEANSAQKSDLSSALADKTVLLIRWETWDASFERFKDETPHLKQDQTMIFAFGA